MEQRQLGQYVLEALLGAGGMGEVYRAHDTVRDRRVALKVLPEAFSHDHEYSSRFRREQHIAARLRDPHIIPIHDFGEADGRLFIDMRLVDGRDLSHLLARGPLPPERAAHLIDQAAQALDSAHSEGLVHRDIKPSNLLTTASGFVYVVDFGIARKVGTTRTSLTVTGATVGTLDYMAPERFTTQPLDARADIYSLACLLYECLTAQRPFPGHDLPSLMYAHFYTEPEPPSRHAADLPEGLDAVVLRGMAKNPDDRFATAGELAAAAHEALGGRALLAPSWTPAGGAAAARHRDLTRHAAVPVAAGAGAAAGATAGAGAGAAAGAGAGAATSRGDETVVDLTDDQVTRLGPAPTPVPAPPAAVDLAKRPAAPPSAPPATTPAAPASGGLGLVVAGGAHRTVEPLPTAGLAPPPPPPPPPPPAQTPTPPRTDDPPTVYAPAGALPTELATWAAPEPAPAPSHAPAAAPQRQQPVVLPAAGPARGPVPPPGRMPPSDDQPPSPGQPFQGQPLAPRPPERPRRRGRLALLLVAAALVVVLIVGGGTWLLVDRLGRGGDDAVPAADSAQDQAPVVAEQSPTASAPPAESVAIPAVGGTIPVGETPGFVEVTPNGRFAYVANRDAMVVTVIDTAVNQVTATISIDAGPPQFIAFSPSGRTAYISTYRKTGDTTYDDNTVVFLDTATNTVTATVPVGQRPFASATTPDGSLLYVPSHDTGRLDVVDVAQQQVVQEIPVAPNPHWVAFGKDGAHVYAANHESGVVSVIDAATNEVIKEIPVGKAPHSTAVSPDGAHVSVVNYDSNEVSVIDTATEEVVMTVPVDAKPQDIAYAPDGHYLYTANVDAGTVDVVDTTSGVVTARIPVGGDPTSISVLPNGKQAYVTLLDQGLVRILDLTA